MSVPLRLLLRFPTVRAAAGLLLALLATLCTAASETAPAPLAPEPLQQRLKALEQADPADPQNARLLEIYRAIVRHLEAAARDRAERERFETLQAQAPATIGRATAGLRELQHAGREQQLPRQNVPVARLERLLHDSRERVAELRAEEGTRQRVLATLQKRLEGARADLKLAGTELAAATAATPAVDGETAPLAEARRLDVQARREAATARLAVLEAEVRTLPDRLAAVQAELKLLAAQRQQAEAALAGLLGLDTLKRIAAAESLRDRVAAADPGMATAAVDLAGLFAGNRALADEYVRLVTGSEVRAEDLAQANAELAELRADYDSIAQQLAIAALSDALGPVLMEHYLKLGGRGDAEARVKHIARQLAEVRLRQLQIAQMLQAEPGLRERSYAALEAAASGVRGRPPGLDAAERLLADRDTLLDALNAAYLQATEDILDLDTAYGEQARLAREFRALLDRNLVWMRTHRALQSHDLVAWPAALVGVLRAQDWQGLRAALPEAARGQAWAVLLAALALFSLLLRSRLDAQLERRSLRSVGWQSYRFGMGLGVLVLHVLSALPIPLLLFALARVLQALDGALAQALATACRDTALLGYGYLLILEVFGSRGFARHHLRWKAARVQHVERLLRVALGIVLPAVFVNGVLGRLFEPLVDNPAYRVSSLLFVGALFAFSVAIARAGRGMFRSAFYARHYPLLGRIGMAMLVAVIAVQPLILVLEVLGYHFTATALHERVFVSILVLVGTRLLLDAGMLGITIAARRSMDRQSEESAAQPPAAGGGTRAPDAAEDFDFERMNASAITLLHVFVPVLASVALLSVWGQFVTALGIFDGVPLWSYSTTVDGDEVQATVSLLDLGTALLIFGMSVVLAKGLPSLIGILFYRFITEKGVLFAIQTVIGYLAIIAGFFIGLQTLGFGWSKLQWMAAGLSVGLGFGLQEIFANFFAGLIMLFERPVRIGDIISLGDFNGMVQRIRMRATTLTDSDNREIIIPNKAFVTERLINWTLSSSVVRVSFDVGIGYGADPRRAQQLLLEIIDADPRVLKQPPAMVIFRDFAPGALQLRCYCHIEDMQVRHAVNNDLHMRITEVFREQGIEIAYPQVDVHLRSIDVPLTVNATGARHDG